MHTNKLLELMKVDPALPGSDQQPQQGPAAVGGVPLGQLHSFKAVVERLQIKFTYFAGDGHAAAGQGRPRR